MNIDLLSKMVKELILDSDCVALPGFGVFIAEIVPATFSDKGYTLNPPYRRLHFRAKDVQDDALASLYASSNDVDLDVANKIVLDFTLELKEVLQKNKVVVFPGLGRLRATKENNFFFVSDEDLDIYPEGFGLEPISLKTHQETKAEVAAVVGDLAGILKYENVRSMASEVEHEEPMSELPVEAAASETEREEPMSELPVEETVADAEQESRNKPEPEAISAGEQETAESVLSSGKEIAPTANKNNATLKTVLIIISVLAGVLVFALLAFLVVADACPDFMDSILYSQEELEILNAWEKL